MLRPGGRRTLSILNVLPLPGLGAILVGWRNPHTTLRRNGALQMMLVLLGTWPVIVPGVAGIVWAVWDAVRIAQAKEIPKPPKSATPPVLLQ
jgi:hypothetical protein